MFEIRGYEIGPIRGHYIIADLHSVMLINNIYIKRFSIYSRKCMVKCNTNLFIALLLCNKEGHLPTNR
ncbi:hypothetical protein PMEGAPR236_21460 [Priestia megaterium]